MISIVRRAGLLAFGACLALASGASAATVGFTHIEADDSTHDQLRYQAATGETNRVTITASPTTGNRQPTYLVRGAGAPLTVRPRAGCRRGPGPGTATCGGAVINSGFPLISLGDRNDSAAVSGVPVPPAQIGFGFDPFNYTILGGAGNDVLTFGPHTFGTLAGGIGADRLTGSAGRDRLVGGPGNDRLNGGAGSDVASWADHRLSVRIDLRRAGPQGSARELDFVTAIEGVVTGRGPDVIVGGPRPDRIESGAGNDSIDTVGGGGDFVLCSTGMDRVRADQLDRLTGCESVTRVG